MKSIIYLIALISSLSIHSVSQKLDCVYGNCQDGFGQLNAIDGGSYVGRFVNGRFDGYGIFSWDTERKYIGYWEKGQLNGKGTLIYGKKMLNGFWAANRFVSKNKVSKLRSDHGQVQLMKMVAPYPELQQCIDSFLFIKQWIIDQFNGASIDQPIFWMDQALVMDTLFDFDACHIYPTKTQEAKVWVRPCEEPMEFIAYLCFEFYNIRSFQLFNELDHDAKTFRCSKNEYILQFAQLEFQAAHQTARFYKEKIASYTSTYNITNLDQWWYVYMPVRFDEWKKTWKKDSYPYIPFGSFYDKMVQGVMKSY